MDADEDGDEFKVEVGLVCWGDGQTDRLGLDRNFSLVMMFADNIVICSGIKWRNI